MTTATQQQAEAGVRYDHYDEMWDGVLVMSPIPGWEHQVLVEDLVLALGAVVRVPRLGHVLPGVNVSDVEAGWRQNYRVPDVAVYLDGNPAVYHEAHVQGGPDLAVEIVSLGEDPHAKLGFYAAVGTREVLIVNRLAGYELGLFRLIDGVLTPAGTATPGVGVLVSQAVGVTFALEPAGPRPAIVVTHPATGRTWRA